MQCRSLEIGGTPLRIAAKEIKGEATARTAVANLITFGIWFTVEPLPEDTWEIAVKHEHQHLLEKL